MRFVKTTVDVVTGSDEITRDDLIGVKTSKYDALVDTVNSTFFDAAANEWKPIPR